MRERERETKNAQAANRKPNKSQETIKRKQTPPRPGKAQWRRNAVQKAQYFPRNGRIERGKKNRRRKVEREKGGMSGIRPGKRMKEEERQQVRETDRSSVRTLSEKGGKKKRSVKKEDDSAKLRFWGRVKKQRRQYEGTEMTNIRESTNDEQGLRTKGRKS